MQRGVKKIYLSRLFVAACCLGFFLNSVYFFISYSMCALD